LTDRTFFYESSEFTKELGNTREKRPMQTLSDPSVTSEDLNGAYTGQWLKN
jgi:hypothetical protein